MKTIKKSYVLHIKSFMYRYFGVFLANKEESEFLQSKEFWKSFLKIYKNSKNDMSPSQIQGLLIGLWESDHGFGRPMSKLSYRKPKLLFNVLAWFDVLFTVIKWDIKFLVAKLKKK